MRWLMWEIRSHCSQSSLLTRILLVSIVTSLLVILRFGTAGTHGARAILAARQSHHGKLLAVNSSQGDSGSSGKLLHFSNTGHPGLSSILQSEVCRGVGHTYEWLIEAQLFQYNDKKMRPNASALPASKDDLTVMLYIKDGQMYVSGQGGGLNKGMSQNYFNYIHSLKQKGSLPDLVMIISGEDHPRAKEVPIFSYCRRSSTNNDLLLPNHVEDRLWRGVNKATESRAGKEDTRAPELIWYGRPHAWYRGHRKIAAQAGLNNPDKIHTGLTDLKTLPEGYRKDKEQEWAKFESNGLPLSQWANRYKYQLNVPGNCASSRLAYQLFSDAAVFIMASEDQEWYTPLLRPYQHYIPVYSEEGTDQHKSKEENMLAQIYWAEQHPDLVAAIVERSTEFAEAHLRPGTGCDCYSLMLLHAYSQLLIGRIEIPENAIPYPKKKSWPWG